jgi:hypothetical protein
MTDKYKDAIEKIVDTITIPGEQITDGECIDAIWFVLETLGYDLSEIQQQKGERK